MWVVGWQSRSQWTINKNCRCRGSSCHTHRPPHLHTVHTGPCTWPLHTTSQGHCHDYIYVCLSVFVDSVSPEQNASETCSTFYLELFSPYITVPELWCEICCFHRCLPLCTHVLLGQVRPPSSILGIRKLDTALPSGDDHFPLPSLILTLTQYWSVMDWKRVFSIFSSSDERVLYTTMCRWRHQN